MTERKNDSDDYWMAKAIQLARKGRFTTTPNPNVGCVIVRDGELVGEGFHQQAGTPHAEVHALAMAGDNAKGATAYVTLEPCSHYGRTPPCTEALIKAKVARVVCAMKDPNPLVAGQGLARLQAEGIATRSNVMNQQAEQLNVGFFKRMRTGVPAVTVKIAASLDGATALANGESQWITGPEARQDVQWGRATACAVVTGIGTVLADDPSMNVRLENLERQPLRIVLDSQLRTPPKARIGQIPGRTVLVHSEQASSERKAILEHQGFECVALATGAEGHLDLSDFLHWCAKQQLNQLWVEAGARLAGSFVEQGLADDILYYQAPTFLGSGTLPVLDMNIHALKDAQPLVVDDVRFIGKDLRWRLRPA